MVDVAYFSQLSYCNSVACLSTKGELLGIQLKPGVFDGVNKRVQGRREDEGREVGGV